MISSLSRSRFFGLKIDTKIVSFHPHQTRHQEEKKFSKSHGFGYPKPVAHLSHQSSSFLVFLAPRMHPRVNPLILPKTQKFFLDFSWLPTLGKEERKWGKICTNSPLFTLQNQRQPKTRSRLDFPWIFA